MRRGFAIFYLLLLGFPFWGTYSIFLHRRAVARRFIAVQIAEGQEHTGLARLSFSNDETSTALEWEHSQEFRFRGEMYDVVCSETKGDSITYYCIADKTETALRQKLDELVKQATNNSPQQKQNLNSLMDFFKSIFCTPLPVLSRHVASNVKQQHLYRCALSSFSNPPPVPPPKA